MPPGGRETIKMPDPLSGPSKSSVRRAGSTVRAFSRGEAQLDQLNVALDLVGEYRATFSYPLLKVNNGLHGCLSRLHIDAEVTQRLKRMSTIVEKLTSRESQLDLSRMQDIGGCRVVTESNDISEARRMEAWIDEVWGARVLRRSDYLAHPRQSGYRALHVIVERDGRPIEIQIRTKRMHTWASNVEAFSDVLGTNFKQDGTSDVQILMRLMADMDVALDAGVTPPTELLANINRHAARLQAHLSGRGGRP